jgi:uncharacterized membrane protein (DUF485 family)
MNAAHFVLPIIGAIVLVFNYVVILMTRSQRLTIMSGEKWERETHTRDREKLWWALTMVIFLATIVGFSSLVSYATNEKLMEHILGIGVILWVLLMIVGYRLTSN